MFLPLIIFHMYFYYFCQIFYWLTVYFFFVPAEFFCEEVVIFCPVFRSSGIPMKLPIHCSKNLDKGNCFSTPLSTSVTTLLFRPFKVAASFTLKGALRNTLSNIDILYSGKLTFGLVTSDKSTDFASIDSSSPKVRSSSNSMTSFFPSYLIVKLCIANNMLTQHTIYKCLSKALLFLRFLPLQYKT